MSTPWIPLEQTGWPLIELGFGLVEVAEGRQPVERADGSKDERPALIFGRNGSGKVGDPLTPDRQMLPGEPLAVVTFANVEGLDVVMGKLQIIRDRMNAGAATVSTARVSRPEEDGAPGSGPAPAAGTPTLGELIAKVGGRINAAGYVEFGSEMAVLALVRSAVEASHGSGVPAPAAVERVEIGSVVLPGISGEEYDEPEFVERPGVLERLQERLIRNGNDRHLSVFVEVPAGVSASDGETAAPVVQVVEPRE